MVFFGTCSLNIDYPKPVSTDPSVDATDPTVDNQVTDQTNNQTTNNDTEPIEPHSTDPLCAPYKFGLAEIACYVWDAAIDDYDASKCKVCIIEK